jgi:CheY-like chemotaxis protein
MGIVLFLIVDDDVNLSHAFERQVARCFLGYGRHDIKVLVANNAEQAISIVEEKHASQPDAEWGLLTDYDMPGRNGLELVDELDAMLKDSLVWRMVITGLLDDERKALIESRHAFAESKPIAKADLEAHLHIFLTSLS